MVVIIERFFLFLICFGLMFQPQPSSLLLKDTTIKKFIGFSFGDINKVDTRCSEMN